MNAKQNSTHIDAVDYGGGNCDSASSTARWLSQLPRRLPDVLDRIEFLRVRRQDKQCDVGGHNQAAGRPVSACAIDLHEAVRARCDMAADFGKVLAHGFKIDAGHYNARAHAARRTYGAEQVGPGGAADRVAPQACRRGAPTRGLACAAGPPMLHPAGRSRAICRQLAAAGRLRSGRQSFLFVVCVGASRSGEMGVRSACGRQAGQQLADAASMILHGEVCLQPLQIDESLADNAVPHQVGVPPKPRTPRAAQASTALGSQGCTGQPRDFEVLNALRTRRRPARTCWGAPTPTGSSRTGLRCCPRRARPRLMTGGDGEIIRRGVAAHRQHVVRR